MAEFFTGVFCGVFLGFGFGILCGMAFAEWAKGD